MDNVRLVRLVGFVEGCSWLLLLFVAMPLKYGFGQPWAVRVVGMGHGILFCLFVVVLLRAHLSERWGLVRSGILFLAALLPFGFLFVDRSLREA
ncbi:MAG: DUF3817 domain-containing protein [Myxococcota bacterium]